MSNQDIILNFKDNQIQSIDWYDEENQTFIKITSTNAITFQELENEITPILEDNYIARIMNSLK